jgi:hypothetical protein
MGLLCAGREQWIMGERQAQRQTGIDYAPPMLTPDLLDQWLPRLQHPAVRDLAWTLLAAPLLAAPGCPQRHPLSASGWWHNPQWLADWLQEQQQQPEPLLDWLQGARSQRLGIHYERLWQFALQQAPGIELLAANLPVRQGGQTLGELDMLLRDAEGDHHLELAIKLYLGPASGDGELPGNWRGAGRADNLQRKLQHLGSQQLLLCASPAAQDILAAHGVQQPRPGLWLSGYLFYPWPGGCASPAGSHPQHARGLWLQHHDWPAFQAASSAQHWQPVARDCRLAPSALQPASSWPAARLEDWRHRLAADAPPILLAGFSQQDDGNWTESSRVMLLNDQWPGDGADQR